jgi:hypothetical protein
MLLPQETGFLKSNGLATAWNKAREIGAGNWVTYPHRIAWGR